MGRRRWSQDRAGELLAALDDFGLTMDHSYAEQIVLDKIDAIVSQLGITPLTARTYLDSDWATVHAQDPADVIADTEPGQQISEMDSDAEVPGLIPTLAIAAVAQSIRVFDAAACGTARITAAHSLLDDLHGVAEGCNGDVVTVPRPALARAASCAEGAVSVALTFAESDP